MNNFAELDGRLLVLFDGHCGLCNGTVRWSLRRDRRDRLRFAAFDSAKGFELLARHGFDLEEMESGSGSVVIVCEFGGPAERAMLRSEAVLALLRELPQPWPSIATALGWLPRPVRDQGYRLVARWRYRIWRRLESCPLPSAEERTQFL